jgi:tol-pal system protein YbgF
MKQLIAAAALLAAACASTQGTDAVPPPAASSADPRIGEMQTTLTELLERLDVLNDRIARLEEERAAAPTVAAAPAQQQQSQPAPAAPRTQPAQQPQRALVGAQLAENYRKAIMLFGRGSYNEARQAFQRFFDAEPAGDLADNALFWIGETYYAARDYTNAMRFYARVVNDFADQNKAPDALYKTALALERTGDLALARKTFQDVIERYPYSTSASSAKQELQRIRY